MIGGWRARLRVPIAALFLLTLPAVATRPHTADEIEYYAFLRSMWFDRDLSFDNEYRYFFDHGFTSDPLFKATFIDRVTPTGHAVTYATIGCALLWAPFFGAADVTVRVARLFGSPVAADGFSTPYLAATAYASAIYGALALAIAAALARRFTGGAATAAALATFAGTPLIFYMYAMPHMSHACSAFAVAAFVWIWFRVRESWSAGGVALLAAAGGLMTMVREQDAFVIAAPVVDYVWTLASRRESASQVLANGATRLGVAALAFGAAVLPQLIAYIAINGRLAPSPDVSGKMYWTAPWAGAVVASPEHGWFFWTPLAVIALAGLLWMAAVGRPESRRMGALLLLTVGTQIYVSGSVLSWTLAGAFGQRRFIAMTVCVVIGLAWVVGHLRAQLASRWLVWPAIAVCVWWNLGLAIQFGENSMDRQRLELGRNVRTTFVDLPRRLPQVAYRYLFNRGSFYRTDR